MHAVILANGTFPTHPIPLRMLREAENLVCCDGAFEKLLSSPHFDHSRAITIVGDGDSLTNALRQQFAESFIRIPDQDTNDLTKTVRHCISQGAKEITILGATGLREDHTLGNVGLLSGYAAQYLDVKFSMLSDYGTFTPVEGRKIFASFPRQQVSLFTLLPQVRVSSKGLQWELNNRGFENLWPGTLNASLGNEFEITSEDGVTLVYTTHDAK